MKYAKCGLECSKCGSFQNQECKGCQEMKGTSFYGPCKWYKCTQEKGFAHCGQCDDFPCDGLKSALEIVGGLYAIENLRK